MIDKPAKNETETRNNRKQRENLNRKPKGAGFALFIASLALFFAAAGIAAGYKHWQRMHDRAKSNARKIEAIEQALPAKTDGKTLEKLRDEVTENINQQQTIAEQQLRKMAEMRTQAEQFSHTVTTQIGQITSLQSRLQQDVVPVNNRDWQIAEVSFLLKLATRELQLSENPDAAIRALKSADQRLSEIGPVSYLPVRQQISKDLASLEAIQTPDIASVSKQINVLLQKLKPASTSISHPPMQTQSTNTDTKNTPMNKGPGSLWFGYKEQMVNKLSDAIIVRQIDKPITASLDEETKAHLYNLIELRMESLRLMALQQQDHAYHEQIELLRKNIESYYPVENTSALLASLNELDAINLKPEIPDISGSLKQLEQTRLADLARAKQ